MATKNGYRDLFQNYVVAGVEVSLAHVREGKGTLSEELRQQAWHTLSYALAIDDAWPTVSALLLALAPIMARLGYWSEWIPYLERGLAQSQSHGDANAEAELSLFLGHVQHRLGQFEPAMRHVSRAASLFSEQGRQAKQGAALNRLAEIVRGQRDFAAAERLADRALALPSTASVAELDERGHSLLVKGRIAFNQERWSEAGRQFEHALQNFQETGNRERLAVCTQNLGRVCTMETDYPNAIAYFQRSIALLEDRGDIFNLAVVRMNLGIVHSLCGRALDALSEYAKAEQVFRRLHERSNLAKVYNNQGMEMNNLKRWTEAEELLTTSSALCLELGDLQNFVNAQDSLGLTYMGLDDYPRAICVFREALALSQERPDLHFAASTLADLSKHLRQAQEADIAHSQPS